MSTKSRQHSNVINTDLLHLCACSSVDCCVLWLHHTTLTFAPAANGFLMDSLSPTSFRAHLCAAVSQPQTLLLLARDALLIKWHGRAIGWRAQGGKEGIDLSVVLGDQLIPIVCASTDSPMCLIWYSLFLLGQDKSLSHHFPLWATNQIKSKGMTARIGFLPRLWLADHNKGRPSIWKVVCAE